MLTRPKVAAPSVPKVISESGVLEEDNKSSSFLQSKNFSTATDFRSLLSELSKSHFFTLEAAFFAYSNHPQIKSFFHFKKLFV